MSITNGSRRSSLISAASTSTVEFSPPYNFASQNVFLSETGPGHFGVAGTNRIYLVYEHIKRVDFYRFINNLSDAKTCDSYFDPGEHQFLKNEFVLEHTVKLHDVNIVQFQYCQLAPEYFSLLTHNQINESRSIRVYNNHLQKFNYEDPFLQRKSSELVNNISHTLDFQDFHLQHIDSLLNVIDFDHPHIGLLAKYFHICPVTGNLGILLINGTTLIYQMVRCLLPTKQRSLAIDFVFFKTISLLDGWSPEVVKLSLNYLSFMGPNHFSLIQIDLSDPTDFSSNYELPEFKHYPQLSAMKDSRVIYNRLFDDPLDPMTIIGNQETQNQHADTVWGPVSQWLACKYSVTDHKPNNKATGSSYNLLLCQHLNLSKLQIRKSNSRIESKLHLIRSNNLTIHGNNVSQQTVTSNDSSKVYFYNFELLPLCDQRTGHVFAHALYVLWANQLSCYLIDLRRDKLRVVPISQLNLSIDLSSEGSTPHKNITIRDFTASPQEDLVHILTEHTLDTYATQLFPFLVADEVQNLYCSRPIVELYQVSSNHFLNVIAAFSSAEFVFLVSGEENHRHTIYNLRRPSIDHLQADILSSLDDIKSNSDDDHCPNSKHALHRLYLQLHSISKFACLFSTTDNTNDQVCSNRLKRLQSFHRKVQQEIDNILREKPTCVTPLCSFITVKFR